MKKTMKKRIEKLEEQVTPAEPIQIANTDKTDVGCPFCNNVPLEQGCSYRLCDEHYRQNVPPPICRIQKVCRVDAENRNSFLDSINDTIQQFNLQGFNLIRSDYISNVLAVYLTFEKDN